MKILFLGTAAAEGYPATFCNCQNCSWARRVGGRNLRARSSIIIDGKVLIDIPPDIRSQALRFGVNLFDVEVLLITHTHDDHFYHRELRLRKWPFVTVEPKYLSVVANSIAIDILNEEYSDVLDLIRVNLIYAEPFKTIELGDYKVTPIIATHKTCYEDEIAYNYIISKDDTSFLYAVDSGPYQSFTLRYLENIRLDLVICEATLCTVSGEVYRYHRNFDNAIEFRDWLIDKGVINKDTSFVLTHFSHVACPSYEKMNEMLKDKEILVAYDGMKINL